MERKLLVILIQIRHGIHSGHKKKDRRGMDGAIDLDLFCKQYKQNRVQMPLMIGLCGFIATQNNHLFKKKATNHRVLDSFR